MTVAVDPADADLPAGSAEAARALFGDRLALALAYARMLVTDGVVRGLIGPREAPRLRALRSTADGFRLAEVDLELRGEGELVGTRQHGLAELRFAELPADAQLLERARMYAQRIESDDPELQLPEHALLADALRGRYGAEALAPIRA